MWISTSAVYFISLTASILLYRGFLHPLGHVPGPFAACLSKLWAVAITLGGRNHVTILELHAKYGDFVRIGPNEVSLSNVEAIQQIYGPRSTYKGVPRPAHSESLMSIRSHAEHSQRHKIWDRAFTTRALKDYHPLLSNRVRQLSDRLASECLKGTVDIGKWFNACAFDVMGDLAFDSGFDIVQKGDIDGYSRTLNEAVRIGAIFINLPWTAVSAKLPWLPVACKKAKLERFAQQQVRKRQAKVAYRKDLSYWLVCASGAAAVTCATQFSPAEAVLVIVAGSDSTSLVAFFLLYFLAQHPSVLNRLRQEIQDVYITHGELTINHLNELPYLNACINESLRLFPPVPNGHPRLAPKGGATVGGYLIPEGTTVIVPAYTIHRDPRYWTEPNAFRPERWLPEGVMEGWHHDTRAFVPFSYGPYSCIGRNLGRQEIRLTIAAVIQRFDFQLAAGFDARAFEQQITGEFLLTRPMLPMLLRERTKCERGWHQDSSC
ncbi:cytochrome P450 [Dacryopinax primogenitus]|uniref:Cytochrome P450 n=1 Tax=Dacryopinax primogenitus (strain DJM 731) TaxID=1858805 RepID=M5G025_DACPD|nr:cytochrome P450 [Dacryopinax primogenitus]EJT99156.1 cytochrome P450 [Dacryopinax primogenitus]